MTANKVINTKDDIGVYEIKLNKITILMVVKHGKVFSVEKSNRATTLKTREVNIDQYQKEIIKKVYEG